jgi:putative nucleotidyltransferase with HDIG domain
MRDDVTEGHSQRVTVMTVQLATKMNIPQEELIHIQRGALLHDVGKMGVPDRILLKPESLTDEERLLMQQHPQLAYEMLKEIDFLQPAIDIPRYHHEWWDGTGYNEGLKGEEIPFAARVFSVVDTWDALVTDRPYRRAWSFQDALDYIQKQSGTQFDPMVVTAFVEMMTEQ